MKKEDRKEVNKVQINRFFRSYYSEWRHIQVLGIQKLLKEKYSFYPEIIEQTKNSDSLAGEATITQEVTNGLMFEAIQANVQYIEDLFSFINACKNPDYFIRDTIKYRAGIVTDSIKKASGLSRKEILKLFYFPAIDAEPESEALNVIRESTDRLIRILDETVEFYKTYAFFYKQYKHGLTVALRPYRDFDEKDVERDKEGTLGEQHLVALDAVNFEGAPHNMYGFSGYLLIPNMQQPVATHMKTLQQENNLLRFVKTPPGMTIEKLVIQAAKTKRCIQILISNFLQCINEENPLSLRLPAPNDSEVYQFQFLPEVPTNK